MMGKMDKIGNMTLTFGNYKIDLYAILAILATIANISAGTIICIAILFFNPLDPISTARLISLGAGFDALDGKLARRSNTSNRFGSKLDTAADQITFATAPALIIWHLLIDTNEIFGIICGLIYFFTASFRLSRYVMAPTSGYFEGMPSPVSAYFIVGWLLQDDLIVPIFGFSTIFISLLMISSFPYSGFRTLRSKFQYFYFIFTISLMLLTNFAPNSLFGLIGDIWIYYVYYFGIIGPFHALHNINIDRSNTE